MATKKKLTYAPLIVLGLALVVLLVVFGSGEQLKGQFNANQVVFTVNSVFEEVEQPEENFTGVTIFEAEFTCKSAGKDPCILQGLEFDAIIEENPDENFKDYVTDIRLVTSDGTVLATDETSDAGKLNFEDFKYPVEPKFTAVLRVLVDEKTIDNTPTLGEATLITPTKEASIDEGPVAKTLELIITKENVKVYNLTAQPVVIIQEKKNRRKTVKVRMTFRPNRGPK